MSVVNLLSESRDPPSAARPIRVAFGLAQFAVPLLFLMNSKNWRLQWFQWYQQERRSASETWIVALLPGNRLSMRKEVDLELCSGDLGFVSIWVDRMNKTMALIDIWEHWQSCWVMATTQGNNARCSFCPIYASNVIMGGIPD